MNASQKSYPHQTPYLDAVVQIVAKQIGAANDSFEAPSTLLYLINAISPDIGEAISELARSYAEWLNEYERQDGTGFPNRSLLIRMLEDRDTKRARLAELVPTAAFPQIPIPGE